jgi:hypothetical protein
VADRLPEALDVEGDGHDPVGRHRGLPKVIWPSYNLNCRVSWRDCVVWARGDFTSKAALPSPMVGFDSVREDESYIVL